MNDAEPIFPAEPQGEPDAEPALPVALAAPPQPSADLPHAVAVEVLANVRTLQEAQDVLGLYLGVPLRLLETDTEVLAYYDQAANPPRQQEPLLRLCYGWPCAPTPDPDCAVVYVGPLHYFRPPANVQAPRALSTMAAFHQVAALRRSPKHDTKTEGRLMAERTLAQLRAQVEQARAELRAVVN